jgi:CRISPR-associated protein Cas2
MMRAYLIAYDIREPKRLGRVHRYLKRIGLALQYSVFVVRLTERQLDRVMRGLSRLIDPRCDDVRAYPVPADPDWLWLGRQALPEEVYLLVHSRPGAVDTLLDQGGDRDG